MANPNIVNVTTINGTTAYIAPSVTTAVATWTYADPSTSGTVSLPGLNPASGTVNKINNIVASNVTGSAVAVTVSINSATGGGGTAYRIAYQISVPANASLIIVDKTTSFYVTQYQSVGVTVGTANAINFTASFEAISA